MKLNLGEIWDDSYVTYLGTLEHLDECKQLHNAYLISKAVKDGKAEKIKAQFDRELADLFLILSNRATNDSEFSKKVNERILKFKEKQNDNKEVL